MTTELLLERLLRALASAYTLHGAALLLVAAAVKSWRSSRRLDRIAAQYAATIEMLRAKRSDQ